MNVYQHEIALGVKHTGAEGLVPVVEGDNVKADGLWDCEEE